MFEETPHASGLAAGFFSSTRPAMPLTTEQLQKHFGQVERHVVETRLTSPDNNKSSKSYPCEKSHS